MKEEYPWLLEWACPFTLIGALVGGITTYNDHYLHSSMGHVSPQQVERDYHTRHSNPFVAA